MGKAKDVIEKGRPGRTIRLGKVVGGGSRRAEDIVEMGCCWLSGTSELPQGRGRRGEGRKRHGHVAGAWPAGSESYVWKADGGRRGARERAAAGGAAAAAFRVLLLGSPM